MARSHLFVLFVYSETVGCPLTQSTLHSFRRANVFSTSTLFKSVITSSCPSSVTRPPILPPKNKTEGRVDESSFLKVKHDSVVRRHKGFLFASISIRMNGNDSKEEFGVPQQPVSLPERGTGLPKHSDDLGEFPRSIRLTRLERNAEKLWVDE